MTKSNFSQEVYRATKKIPEGKVTTYGQIAAFIGRPGASRAVGQALNKNPNAPIVPCHRVVASNGHLRGFARGLKVKEGILKKEGVKVVNCKIDLKKHPFSLK